MNAGVVIEGVVRPDGTLELVGKLPLPSGPVRVTVEPVPAPQGGFLQRMQAIWDARQHAGLTPRSAEEVEAEREETRQQWEERSRRLEGGQGESDLS